MNKFLHSRFGTIALVLALVAAGFVAVRALTQKFQIDRQIRQLEARAEQIKGDNQNLSDLVNYLQTDQYKEKAAREQLNLKKDGEVVVALPQANSQEDVSSAQTSAQRAGNPQKWYAYFFQHDGNE